MAEGLALLLEDGTALLLEDGTAVLLEAIAHGVTATVGLVAGGPGTGHEFRGQPVLVRFGAVALARGSQTQVAYGVVNVPFAGPVTLPPGRKTVTVAVRSTLGATALIVARSTHVGRARADTGGVITGRARKITTGKVNAAVGFSSTTQHIQHVLGRARATAGLAAVPLGAKGAPRRVVAPVGVAATARASQLVEPAKGAPVFALVGFNAVVGTGTKASAPHIIATLIVTIGANATGPGTAHRTGRVNAAVGLAAGAQLGMMTATAGVVAPFGATATVGAGGRAATGRVNAAVGLVALSRQKIGTLKGVAITYRPIRKGVGIRVG